LRYNGNYIQAPNPSFELDFITVFRNWLFTKYFVNHDTIYEFGCGTGFNLALLDKLIPGKELHGLDFVQTSVDLVNQIGGTGNSNINGHLFDMTCPRDDFSLREDSAVFTFCAIEQLDGKFEKFIRYLLDQRPKISIHVEPVFELYDANNLVDYLAIKFHQKRRYTTNFLPHLQDLESREKLRISMVKRLYFGSLLHEAYTYIIWEPLEG